MYLYYNAHPKGFLVDDSVIRAVSVAARIDYLEAHRELNSRKRVSGDEGFWSERNPRCYVEQILDAKRISFERRKGILRMTVSRFSKLYPRGRYILDLGWHWSVCINGIIIDTWDCSDEQVLAAYLVTPVSEEQKIKLRFCYTVQSVDENKINVTFYDGNGKHFSKTLSEDDAKTYIESLKKRGYPDMTDRDAWV